VIVLEDYAGKGSRRCQRIQWLINDISQLAAKQKIRVRSFSRAKVKQTFAESGASNKYEIAIAIAKRFPELTTRLPRFRKPWMSEDYRMSIFDGDRVRDGVPQCKALMDCDPNVTDL
jgi:hypothetical protein